MKKTFYILLITLFVLLLGATPADADSHCFDVETSKGTLSTVVEASSNETILGEINATGCDIGVYVPAGVKNVTISAEIHDANQYGVFNNGNATVINSDIYHIGNHDGSGDYAPNGGQYGIGVYFYEASGAVKGSDVHEYQKGGIVINQESRANVTGNTVVGTVPVAYIAQNGIQFGYGSTGNAMRNEVSGNWYTGANWASTGILVFETDNVTIQDNTITGSQIGVGIEAWCWYNQSASNNKVVQNTINGSDWGVSVATWNWVYSDCDPKADNNKITNNVITSNTGYDGISITANEYGGDYTAYADNNKVVRNTITGFGMNISQLGDTASKIHANVIE